MTETENWLPVVDYEGYYEVSDQGRVRSLDRVVSVNGGARLHRGRVLRACLNADYLFVSLHEDGKSRNYYVHRLVLEAFVGPCLDGMVAGFIDDDTSNIRLDNLHWVKQSDEKKLKGRHLGPSTEDHGPIKLAENDVKQIRELYGTPGRGQGQRVLPGEWSYDALAEKFGVASSSICRIVKGEKWKDSSLPAFSDDQILEIRALYKSTEHLAKLDPDRWTYKKLAARFDLSVHIIYTVLKGKLGWDVNER